MIHVEPGVTMEQLVRAALAHGMVPKVAAPYRHATVGGAVRRSFLPLLVPFRSMDHSIQSEGDEILPFCLTD